jgi:hypothetical protein
VCTKQARFASNLLSAEIAAAAVAFSDKFPPPSSVPLLRRFSAIFQPHTTQFHTARKQSCAKLKLKLKVAS